jgi:protoheme ferro-lyase
MSPQFSEKTVGSIISGIETDLHSLRALLKEISKQQQFTTHAAYLLNELGDARRRIQRVLAVCGPT